MKVSHLFEGKLPEIFKQVFDEHDPSLDKATKAKVIQHLLAMGETLPTMPSHNEAARLVKQALKAITKAE